MTIDLSAEINQYISQLKTNSGNPAGEAEKNRTRNILTAFCSELSTWPNKTDYETYETALTEAGRDKKYISERTNRIKRFFSCLQAEKERDNMTENEVYAQQDNETSTEITAHTEPEIQPEKKKPGRKRFDTVNGEKKSEKLMLYLTPELISRIRIWCDMKGVSNVSYITALIEADLDSKTDKINAFLELRKGL